MIAAKNFKNNQNYISTKSNKSSRVVKKTIDMKLKKQIIILTRIYSRKLSKFKRFTTQQCDI